MVSIRFVLLLMAGLLVSACGAPVQETAPRSQAGRGAGLTPLVGVYYYPWYGYSGRGYDFSDTLRGHLDPPQTPEIGPYNSRDPGVLDRHIDYSHRGNIRFWAMSWWGPDSAADITIRDHYLKHPRAGEVQFCIHYESPGRLGSFDEPSFDNLIDDFHYLARTYFNRDNYLRIDGRPVVIIYLTRAYFLTEDSRRAARDLRKAILNDLGLELYLVGDDFFVDGLDPQRAKLWDAVTSFDVYGMAFQTYGATPVGLDVLTVLHRDASDAAKNLGLGFIPTVSPGYNDTAVRGGHVPRARYLTRDGVAQEHGSMFSMSLSQTALPFIDVSTGGILMINSFNEWYEDTQIEPTAPAEATDRDDSGEQQKYTNGIRYESYGNKYLDILADTTRPELRTGQ